MHATRTCRSAQPGATLIRAWWFLTLLFILRPQAAYSGTGQYSIQFKQQLQISKDLKLTGELGSAVVRFACESAWKPSAGSALHLFISHSPDLDGTRSFLSVTLNYGILRSLRLDESNQSTAEITIPLPPEMLRPENEIRFSVEQFSGVHRSTEIWTAIKPSSFITVQYDENRPALDLSLLPSPLVDRRSYRPQQLSVLLPNRPSSQTLEATALLIANYSAGLGEGLTIHPVHSVDAASDRLLIVGTPEEQPLRLLASQLPVGLFRTANKVRPGTRDQELFPTDDGIIALSQRPGKALSLVLAVTGNSSDAVSRAVRRLIEGHLEGGSSFVTVDADVRLTPRLPREWEGFLPATGHFTLGQMGFEELKLDSQNNFSLSVPLRSTPDAQFLAYGHQMTLRFRFKSDVSLEKAKLDVALNGSNLGRFAASEFAAGSRPSIQLKIPASLLRRQNILTLRLDGMEGSPSENAAAWLLPTSEFDLPRDYRSDLPDLQLLQDGLFPFGLKSDLSDTIVVVPDDSSGEVTAGLFQLAGLLGRLLPSDRFAFRVNREADFNMESARSAHVIRFRIGDFL